MQRRRSPYALATENDPNAYQSPYAVPDPEEEGQSPLMRQAMAQNMGAADQGYGGGAGLVAEALQGDPGDPGDTGIEPVPAPIDESKYASATGTADPGQSREGGGSMSWMTDAPEASGAAPFSTTPENRAPRSSDPITKADLPKTEESPSEPSPLEKAMAERARKSRAKVDEYDAKIDKLNDKLGSWGVGLSRMGFPGLARGDQMQMHALQTQRRNYESDAMAAENRKGQLEKYKVETRAASSKYAADLRHSGSLARSTAIEKGDIEEGTGHKWYADPGTGLPKKFEIPAQPAKGNVLDADDQTAKSKYSFAQPAYAPRFAQKGAAASAKEDDVTRVETDDAGNLTAITKSGKTKFLGKGGRSAPERAEKENPDEKENRAVEAGARASGRAARSAYGRDPLNTEGKSPEAVRQGEQKAYRNAYEDAGGKGAEALPNAFAEKYPKGTEKAYKRTGTDIEDVFVSDGKTWVKKTGQGVRPARSH